MRRRRFPSPSPRAQLASVGVVTAAALALSACGTGGDDAPDPDPVTTTVTAPDDEPPLTPAETTATAAPDDVAGTETGAGTVTVTVPPETTNSPTAPPPLGSPDLSLKQRRAEGAWQLAVVGVRVAQHERFDRVVFDLEGQGSPGWFIDYTTDPRQQASGYPIEYEGAIALQVNIEGTPYPFDVDPKPIDLGPVPGTASATDLITGINFTTIFEGRSEFVIGLTEQVPYSISLLKEPTRIVIDFARD